MEVGYEFLVDHALQQAMTIGVVKSSSVLAVCENLDGVSADSVGDTICKMFGKDTVYCVSGEYIEYVQNLRSVADMLIDLTGQEIDSYNKFN